MNVEQILVLAERCRLLNATCLHANAALVAAREALMVAEEQERLARLALNDAGKTLWTAIAAPGRNRGDE